MLQNFQSSFAAREYSKYDFVDFERADLTRLKAVDGYLDATDGLAKLLLVIGSDGLASGPTF